MDGLKNYLLTSSIDKDFVEKYHNILIKDDEYINYNSGFISSWPYIVKNSKKIINFIDLPGNSKYDLFKSNELHPNMELGIDNAIKVVSKALPKINSILN